MDTVYSHHILSACILGANKHWHNWKPNVHDNNLIDYHTFHLRLVLDSKVSLAYGVKVDKLFSVLYEKT